MSKEYLAIITARSGSKRLPNKNTRNLCGKPLFVWSVLAGINCSQITRTVVSTDSRQYQKIARDAGADCPWLRSPSLASDTATSSDVVLDVLHRLKSELEKYNGIVLLQPTSPLRIVDDICGSIELFESTNAPAVISICEAECPPSWMRQLSPELIISEQLQPTIDSKKHFNKEKWYRPNGAVYVIGADTLQRTKSFTPPGTLGYKMPRERSIDVDTEFDLMLASLLMAQKNA